jgi:quaternary ammonium compound-resistance protein SugE
MAWILLICSGFLETAWAIGFKYTDGLTKFWPSMFTLVAVIASMGLLGVAMRDLPIGTAYAVWVGIGAVGTVILGIVLFNEPANFARLFFVGLLLVAIIGLKMTHRDANSIP